MGPAAGVAGPISEFFNCMYSYCIRAVSQGKDFELQRQIDLIDSDRIESRVFEGVRFL